MHALVRDLGMPRNPEQKSQKALARGKLEVDAGAKVSSSAEVRLRLFEEAVQAVHVTPIEEGWQVFRIGTDPRVFPEKSQAINFAEIDAKKYNVPALIHESGQARTISGQARTIS
jgi:hypothetical protein